MCPSFYNKLKLITTVMPQGSDRVEILLRAVLRPFRAGKTSKLKCQNIKYVKFLVFTIFGLAKETLFINLPCQRYSGVAFTSLCKNYGTFCCSGTTHC